MRKAFIIIMEWIWIAIAALAVFATSAFFIIKAALGSRADVGIESVIGERCVVTELIDNFMGCGQVSVRGQNWSARAANDDDSFEVGEKLSVVAVEGVKLICVKR